MGRPLTEEDIHKLHNFTLNEKTIYKTLVFEKYWEIDADFVILLDQTITIAKQIYGRENGKFIVHDFNLRTHKPNSYHYAVNDHLCIAVDGHFKGVSFEDAYILFSKMGCRAFGIYSEWQNPGFHIDFRPQRHISTWTAHYEVKDGKRIQIYDYNLYSFIKALKSDRSTVYNTV